MDGGDTWPPGVKQKSMINYGNVIFPNNREMMECVMSQNGIYTRLNNGATAKINRIQQKAPLRDFFNKKFKEKLKVEFPKRTSQRKL